jgi:transmembrane sensor
MENSFSTVEDVIADEAFQSWYSGADQAAVKEWEQRIVREPALASLVQEATAYMQALAVQEKAVPESQVMTAEQRLMTTLAGMDEKTITPVIGMKRSMSRWWWAAAAVLIIAVSGVALWNQRPVQPTLVHTSFGEIREQQLPDGSKVMLNANSEISYKEGASREIWLKGEAFFHVAKTPTKERFIVHADQFDVVVTGTQFNVKNREGRTNVMLTEGSVILKTRDGKDIYMKPGDFVEFNAQEPPVKLAKEEEKVLAWKEKKLYFEKTPLSIAAQDIEQLYGVTIRLGSQKVRDWTLGGIMDNNSLDEFLKALEFSSNFHIVRKNNEIIITE